MANRRACTSLTAHAIARDWSAHWDAPHCAARRRCAAASQPSAPPRDARAARGRDPSSRSRPRRLAPSPATHSRPVTTVAVAPGSWHRGQSVPAHGLFMPGTGRYCLGLLLLQGCGRPMRPRFHRRCAGIGRGRMRSRLAPGPPTSGGRFRSPIRSWPSSAQMATRAATPTGAATPRPRRAAGLQRLEGADAFPGPAAASSPAWSRGPGSLLEVPHRPSDVPC